MPILMNEVERPRQGSSLQGTCVLLVHEDFQRLAHHHDLLRSLGCQVTACTSYDAGLRLLPKEPWELVIVSQGTAAFEGRRVLERAIELNRHTPVLILTRWHHVPTYIKAMHLGAVDYLEEPLDPSELARVINSYARPQAESGGCSSHSVPSATQATP